MPNITDLVPAGEITDQQMLFIAEYVIDLNATQAAIRAGYSEDTARVQGPRLLRNVAIARALKAYREKIADETGLTAGDIIRKAMEVADRCMQAEPVLEYDFAEQKMMPTGEWQFDSKGAIAAWTLISKMLGHIDNKAPTGSSTGNKGGFTLNIITRAAQLEMKQAGITLDGVASVVRDGQQHGA